MHQQRDPRQILIRDGLAGGPSKLRAARWVVCNVIPRVRPPVCCVKPGRLGRFITCNTSCTQRFNATNIHKEPGPAVFAPKVTLATSFQGSLPYIFAGLLPLPHAGKKPGRKR
jgi:hypothetical protein